MELILNKQSIRCWAFWLKGTTEFQIESIPPLLVLPSLLASSIHTGMAYGIVPYNIFSARASSGAREALTYAIYIILLYYIIIYFLWSYMHIVCASTSIGITTSTYLKADASEESWSETKAIEKKYFINFSFYSVLCFRCSKTLCGSLHPRQLFSNCAVMSFRFVINNMHSLKVHQKEVCEYSCRSGLQSFNFHIRRTCNTHGRENALWYGKPKHDSGKEGDDHIKDRRKLNIQNRKNLRRAVGRSMPTWICRATDASKQTLKWTTKHILDCICLVSAMCAS